jgi:hypothetical protein
MKIPIDVTKASKRDHGLWTFHTDQVIKNPELPEAARRLIKKAIAEARSGKSPKLVFSTTAQNRKKEYELDCHLSRLSHKSPDFVFSHMGGINTSVNDTPVRLTAVGVRWGGYKEDTIR